MDIDNQLSLLEGKSTIIQFGQKAVFIKIGISLLLGIVLTFLIKPIYVLDITYDKSEGECKPSINYKNFLISSFLISIGAYFAINKLPYFN